jgi:hypothetical protein
MTAQADTEISDQFGLKDRGAGFPLNRTATETGDTLWEASKTVLLNGAKDAGYIAVGEPAPFSARVPVPGGAKVITVEVSLHVAPASPDKPNWLAIGIGNPPLGSPPWGGGVYLRVDPSGRFGVAYSGDPNDWTSTNVISLKSGTVPEFDPDGLTKLKLEYNSETQTISGWANGESIFQDISVKDHQIDPAFAGFSGFGQQPNIKTAGAFLLTVSP